MIPRSVLQKKRETKTRYGPKPVIGSQKRTAYESARAGQCVDVHSQSVDVHSQSVDVHSVQPPSNVDPNLQAREVSDRLDNCSAGGNECAMNQSTESGKCKMLYSSAVSLPGAIRSQPNPPLVDVGPLAPSNKVPMYTRNRAPAKHNLSSVNVSTGLAWEPPRRRYGGPKSCSEFSHAGNT